MEAATQRKKRSRRPNPIGSRMTVFKVFPEESDGPSNGQEMLLNPIPTGHRGGRRSTKRDKRVNLKARSARQVSSPPPSLTPDPPEASGLSIAGSAAFVPVVDQPTNYHTAHSLPPPQVYWNTGGPATFREHDYNSGMADICSTFLNYNLPPAPHERSPMVPCSPLMGPRDNGVQGSYLDPLPLTHNMPPLPHQSFYTSFPQGMQPTPLESLTEYYPVVGDGDMTQTYPAQGSDYYFMASGVTDSTMEPFSEVVWTQQSGLAGQVLESGIGFPIYTSNGYGPHRHPGSNGDSADIRFNMF